jgi:hypothetical protein
LSTHRRHRRRSLSPIAMSSLRRFAALLTGLLMLQRMLPGGRTCESHHRATPHAARAVGHAAQHAHVASVTVVPADGCGAGQMSGACAMPSCAAPPSLPVIAAASVAPSTQAALLPETISAGSRSAAGPEAPPPRG